jgi:hypothetical protein
MGFSVDGEDKDKSLNNTHTFSPKTFTSPFLRELCGFEPACSFSSCSRKNENGLQPKEQIYILVFFYTIRRENGDIDVLGDSSDEDDFESDVTYSKEDSESGWIIAERFQKGST